MTHSNPNPSARILIVDDNEANRRLLATQLRRVGYEPHEVADGYAALQCVEQDEPYDLVLLDIRMPGMDGLQVLRHLREKHSALQLPVIMVTAESQHESVVQALEQGANDYITKPLALTITLARVHSQLSLRRMARLKDEFLSFASHDLKKPLMVLHDIVETIVDERPGGARLSAEQHALLDMMHKTILNMRTVIDGFLDTEASRTTGQTPARSAVVDVNLLVRQTLEHNAAYAQRKRVVLSSQLQTDIPSAKGDTFGLRQVLDNLVGNALKFSPPDTTTVVKTHVDAQGICVEICDQGPGFKTEDFGRLFQKHAKLSNRPTGEESSSGVGLALSKQLVESMGGAIGAHNNPLHGATFWIKLPV